MEQKGVFKLYYILYPCQIITQVFSLYVFLSLWIFFFDLNIILFIYFLYSTFLLVIYFIHISVYVNPNLPIHPTDLWI